MRIGNLVLQDISILVAKTTYPALKTVCLACHFGRTGKYLKPSFKRTDLNGQEKQIRMYFVRQATLRAIIRPGAITGNIRLACRIVVSLYHFITFLILSQIIFLIFFNFPLNEIVKLDSVNRT